MNAIRNLWNAFANLAHAVNGLASIIETASGHLQRQLGPDHDQPALPHGEVLEDSAGGSRIAGRRRIAKD